MNAHPHTETPTTWDDEIDLRQLIETLLQRKWMIAALIAVSVAAAAVYSYFLTTPRYESTVVVALPGASDSERFGMGVQSYEAFAISSAVLREMVRLSGFDADPLVMKTRLTVRLDATPRLIHVTARASTAEDARRLADWWQSAFQTSLSAHAEVFITDRLRGAEDNVRSAEAGAATAVQSLEGFERENSLAVKEARLARWEEELVHAESRHSELTQQLIPLDSGRVAILEELLSAVAPTLSSGSGLTVVPGATSPAGVASSAVTVLNPDFLGLSQDLNMTRSRLATNKLAAELLEERLAELPETIDALRSELEGLRAGHVRLENEARAAGDLYAAMLQKVKELASTHGSIEMLSSATVISEPMLPGGPVAPRPALNIALAAALAGFVGVGVAFFQQFWSNGET